MSVKFTTTEEHIAAVQELEWHLSAVLREAKKPAIAKLQNEIYERTKVDGNILRDFVEIDGDIYKIGECIEKGRRNGEGTFIARRYKANGELVNYDSLVSMQLDPRDVDPDEGDREEWELEQEFYNKMEDKNG